MKHNQAITIGMCCFTCRWPFTDIDYLGSRQKKITTSTRGEDGGGWGEDGGGYGGGWGEDWGGSGEDGGGYGGGWGEDEGGYGGGWGEDGGGYGVGMGVGGVRMGVGMGVGGVRMGVGGVGWISVSEKKTKTTDLLEYKPEISLLAPRPLEW